MSVGSRLWYRLEMAKVCIPPGLTVAGRVAFRLAARRELAREVAAAQADAKAVREAARQARSAERLKAYWARQRPQDALGAIHPPQPGLDPAGPSSQQRRLAVAGNISPPIDFRTLHRRWLQARGRPGPEALELQRELTKAAAVPW